jgi:hypothetical protein
MSILEHIFLLSLPFSFFLICHFITFLICIDTFKEYKKIYSELKYKKFYKTEYVDLDYDKNKNCIYFDLKFEYVRLSKDKVIYIGKDNYPFINYILSHFHVYWNLRFKKWFKKNIDFKNIPLHE